VTQWRQSMMLWALHNYPISSLTQHRSCVLKLFRCSPCWQEFILVSNYFFRWRGLKKFTATVDWWPPSSNPKDVLSPKPEARHRWTSIQEKMPGMWLEHIEIKFARRPWAPRTFLDFAIKTGYILNPWNILCFLWVFLAFLKVLEQLWNCSL